MECDGFLYLEKNYRSWNSWVQNKGNFKYTSCFTCQYFMWLLYYSVIHLTTSYIARSVYKLATFANFLEFI